MRVVQQVVAWILAIVAFAIFGLGAAFAMLLVFSPEPKQSATLAKALREANALREGGHH